MKLIPPDKKRCQAEVIVQTFMTFGIRPNERCKNKPTVIIRERKYPRGAMSLCDSCLAVAIKQLGSATFTIKKLK